MVLPMIVITPYEISYDWLHLTMLPQFLLRPQFFKGRITLLPVVGVQIVGLGGGSERVKY